MSWADMTVICLVLCGCFAASGPGTLVKINSIMDSPNYRDIKTDASFNKMIISSIQINNEMAVGTQNQCFAMTISISIFKPY